MTDKICKCPFCGGDPWFEGDGDNWRDDRRYVQMKLVCCVTMSSAIGWSAARDMQSKDREEFLKKALVEKWNKRPEKRVIGEILHDSKLHPYARLRTAYDENGDGWTSGTKIYAL